MRDYLKHVYGVKILSVRSVVEQQKVTRMKRDGTGFGPWRRPQSKKKMTVEMTEPFVWPDPPEDMSPYVFVPVPFACTVYEIREMGLLTVDFSFLQMGTRTLPQGSGV